MAAAVALLVAPADGHASRFAQADPVALVAYVDSAYFAADPAASLAACERTFRDGTDDVELRWRATRAAIALGMLTTHMPTRTAHYDTAIAHARRALALSPQSNHARYWLAAAAGRRARADDLRLGIRLANEVRDLVFAILATDSLHAGAHHALGMLHAEALKMPAWARVIASHFFGLDLARHASWKDAERHLRRAIELDPTMVVFVADLADVYGRTGRPTDRERALDRLEGLPAVHPMDSAYRDACVKRWSAVAHAGGRR
jgi:tetratricopeptide (TPR) repeat protein